MGKVKAYGTLMESTRTIHMPHDRKVHYGRESFGIGPGRKGIIDFSDDLHGLLRAWVVLFSF